MNILPEKTEDIKGKKINYPATFGEKRLKITEKERIRAIIQAIFSKRIDFSQNY